MLEKSQTKRQCWKMMTKLLRHIIPISKSPVFALVVPSITKHFWNFQAHRDNGKMKTFKNIKYHIVNLKNLVANIKGFK